VVVAAAMEGADMLEVDTEAEGAVTEVEEVDIWVEGGGLPERGYIIVEAEGIVVGDMGTPIGIFHIGLTQCYVIRIVIVVSMQFVETDIVLDDNILSLE